MADDKKNIPDAGKVDEPPKPGKVEPVKADPPVQDQSAPAKADASVVEGAFKVVTPPTAEKPVEGKTVPDPAAEQPAPAVKEAPKNKDAPAPSKEGTPLGKDEKQTTIPDMGDPAPAGKVVDFTAARDGAVKGKPPEKAAAPDKGKQADKAKDAAKPRRGRPPKADKAAPDKAKPQPRDKMSQSKRATNCATPGYEVVRRSGRILLNCAILSHMELENSMGIQTSSAVLDWSMCWYMQDWIFISIPLSSPEKYPLAKPEDIFLQFEPYSCRRRSTTE